MTKPIWHQPINLEQCNARGQNTINEVLGIHITEAGTDYICATMPVDHRTHQPLGLLHGGASVVLAEGLASLAGNLCVDQTKHYCVGLEINANHLRSVKTGTVTGRAEPVHLGRTTQVWNITIVNDQQQQVCVSRLTLAVMSH